MAGDTEDGTSGGESAPEKAMKASLMSVLRKQLEQEDGNASAAGDAKPLVDGTTDGKTDTANSDAPSTKMDTDPPTILTEPEDTTTKMDSTPTTAAL